MTVEVSGGSGSSTSLGVSARFNCIDRQVELKIERGDGERLICDEVGR